MPRLPRLPRALALGLLLSFAAPALADDAERAKPYAIGDAVAEFTRTDLDGKAFTLSAARSLTAEKALEAVKAAAKGAGAADPKPEDAIDALPGLKTADAVDAAKRLAWVRALGHEQGLCPSAAAAAELRTLGDATKWLAASATAPIVLLCWKAGCPTTKLYQERILALFGAGTARLYVLAVNPKEDDQTLRDHLKEQGLPWRVLDDRDLAVTERLGGRKTPHAFLLDAKNFLRYSGAIDDEYFGVPKKPEQVIPYLAMAVDAVAKGSGPWIQMTEPVG